MEALFSKVHSVNGCRADFGLAIHFEVAEVTLPGVFSLKFSMSSEKTFAISL